MKNSSEECLKSCSSQSKYSLDCRDRIYFEGHTLYRIIYKDGSKGGWLKGYHNLSQEGSCKVLEEAKVLDVARVEDNAIISENAVISQNVVVKGDSIVSGNSRVNGNLNLLDNIKVLDFAVLFGSGDLRGFQKFSGNAHVNYGAISLDV